MNRLPVAVMAVAVLLLLMVPVSSAVAADGEDDALPQELYPDADIIVTDDDGSVLVTKRLAEPDPDGQTHTVQRYRQNSDLTLADWTDVDGSVSIVFDGASVRNLTVLSLDTISDPEAPVDVEFTMVSGSATSITGVSAVLRVETALPDSHFTAYSPVSSLTMSIAGDVDVVSASDCLVEIGSIDITVKKGARIDRLYPSGEDGRCTDLSVTIAGGDVGLAQDVHSGDLVVVLQPLLDGAVADVPVLIAGAGGGHLGAHVLLQVGAADDVAQIVPLLAAGVAGAAGAATAGRG